MITYLPLPLNTLYSNFESGSRSSSQTGFSSWASSINCRRSVRFWSIKQIVLSSNCKNAWNIHSPLAYRYFFQKSLNLLSQEIIFLEKLHAVFSCSVDDNTFSSRDWNAYVSININVSFFNNHVTFKVCKKK